jgi:hypothetical protein
MGIPQTALAELRNQGAMSFRDKLAGAPEPPV